MCQFFGRQNREHGPPCCGLRAGKATDRVLLWTREPRLDIGLEPEWKSETYTASRRHHGIASVDAGLYLCHWPNLSGLFLIFQGEY